MFGFNCCRAATTTWIEPTYDQIFMHGGLAIRDDFWGTGWNDPIFKNLELVSPPPRAYYGRFAYNFPTFKLPDNSDADYGRCVILGAKRAVYSGLPEIQELPSGNANQDLVAYPFAWLVQPFPTIGQGAPISSAQLVLNRNSRIVNPPINIQAIAKVWNNAASYTGWPVNATQYPWSPTNTYGGSPVLGTQPFLPSHQFGVTGDQILVDLTADVQTVINRPSWSSTNCWITVLIYTVYPQPQLWVNSIHPSAAWPNYPATNTASWISEFTPKTTPLPLVDTRGAYVRIAL